MLIQLFMAAFMLQWQRWVISTETVCPAQPRRVTIWPFRENKLPSPGYSLLQLPLCPAEARGALGRRLSVTWLASPLLHCATHFRGTEKLAFITWPRSTYNFRCFQLWSSRQKGHLSAKHYFFPLCVQSGFLSWGDFLKATGSPRCGVTCQFEGFWCP